MLTINSIKEKLFNLLTSQGEVPTRISDDVVKWCIIHRGIIYSKYKSNGKWTYNVEDTSTWDNYHPITNMMVLESLLEKLQNENR